MCGHILPLMANSETRRAHIDRCPKATDDDRRECGTHATKRHRASSSRHAQSVRERSPDRKRQTTLRPACVNPAVIARAQRLQYEWAVATMIPFRKFDHPLFSKLLTTYASDARPASSDVMRTRLHKTVSEGLSFNKADTEAPPYIPLTCFVSLAEVTSKIRDCLKGELVQLSFDSASDDVGRSVCGVSACIRDNEFFLTSFPHNGEDHDSAYYASRMCDAYEEVVKAGGAPILILTDNEPVMPKAARLLQVRQAFSHP